MGQNDVSSRIKYISRAVYQSFRLFGLVYLPNGIKNGEETALIGGLKHFYLLCSKFKELNLLLYYIGSLIAYLNG